MTDRASVLSTGTSGSRSATGSSPKKLTRSGMNQESELRVPVEGSIRRELQDSCFEVTIDDFQKCFLYPDEDHSSTSSQYAADEIKAHEVFNQVQAEGAWLRGNGMKELDFQPLAARFMSDILRRFEDVLGASLQHWDRVSPPGPAARNPDPLFKQFIHPKCKPTFTRKDALHDKFKLDIALIKSDGSDTEVIRSSLHWGDVLVPIEVKVEGNLMTTEKIAQIARYARSVKLEQYDRSFSFGVLMNPDGFRLWRWDTACCYVSSECPFNSFLFVKLMGRLATASPEVLGFDPSFSDAGRLLATDNVTRFLTIDPLPPYISPQPAQGPSTATSDDPLLAPLSTSTTAAPLPSLQYRLDPTPLFEAWDYLFCRTTRVWKAYLVDGETEAPVAIKQNWHDRSREEEAMFYSIAAGIPGVMRMQVWTKVTSTDLGIDVPIIGRHRVALMGGNDREMVRFETATTMVPIYQRDLVRIVFDEIGDPLEQLSGPEELLMAVCDTVKGMKQLQEVGVLHRDISLGNILLSPMRHIAGNPTAKLIDLGVAMRIPLPEFQVVTPAGGDEHEDEGRLLESAGNAGDNKDTTPSDRSQNAQDKGPHHHVTGTWAYMACALMRAEVDPTSTGDPPPIHATHHDLESQFWTYFVICHMDPARGRSNPVLKKFFRAELDQVYLMKNEFLNSPSDIKLPDRWIRLEEFFQQWASLCDATRKLEKKEGSLFDDEAPMNCDVVLELAESALRDIRDPAYRPRPRPKQKERKRTVEQAAVVWHPVPAKRSKTK